MLGFKGSEIRLHREAAKMSLDDLSSITGVAKSYLWNIEKSKSIPSIDIAAKLSNALNIDLSDLCGIPSVGDLLTGRQKSLILKIGKLSESDRDKIEKIIDIFVEGE